MKIANGWKNFNIIATGSGEKLEDWNGVILLRPDPQVIWKPSFELSKYKSLCAIYERSNSGGGRWQDLKPYKKEWTVSWNNLHFLVSPMGFKHTGLFPEQSVNWEKMMNVIKSADRKISVLNLFAYTGGATVACMSAGACVTHVDAAKNMVERAGKNIELNKLDRTNIRFIVDDCVKFVKREIKRGKKYDAIIMDPPSYGKGPNGELWKIEDKLFDLCMLCKEVLSDNPLFFLINSYTTGLQPAVLSNILRLTVQGEIESYEVCLPTDEKIVLPCGCSGFSYLENSLKDK